MSNYINLPTIPKNVQPVEPQQPEKPPVDSSTQVDSSAQGQVSSPLSGSHETESQVDVRADQGIVEPQSLTQVIEPNTESNIPQQSTSRPKLPFRRKRSDKVGTMNEPTALPPLKKRKILCEATIIPFVSSQQDMDFEMTNEQYLGSFSQQDDPIEIPHRAMAPCTESHTLALLQVPHDILIEEIEDTVSGQELQLVTVPTIVTVEEH